MADVNRPNNGPRRPTVGPLVIAVVLVAAVVALLLAITAFGA